MSRRRAVTPEKAWQRTIVEAATLSGWLTLHFPNMQMNPQGFPDLICFRDGRVLLLELKSEIGTVSPRQAEMHERLSQAGHTVHILRPDDHWPSILELLQ